MRTPERHPEPPLGGSPWPPQLAAGRPGPQDAALPLATSRHHRGQDRNIHFKDYAPQVYRRIRALFGVSERDYVLSLGPEQAPPHPDPSL